MGYINCEMKQEWNEKNNGNLKEITYLEWWWKYHCDWKKMINLINVLNELFKRQQKRLADSKI
jgi:hypothetical protein